MRYLLWHIDSGNLIGDFATSEEMVAGIRVEVATNDDLDELMLQANYGDHSEYIGSGRELADLVGSAQRSPTPVAAH